MVDKISSLIRKKKMSGLYKQWVASDGLASEDLPGDKITDDADSVVPEKNNLKPSSEIYTQRESTGYEKRDIAVFVRYIWILGITVVVLLIILAVLITLLVMK